MFPQTAGAQLRFVNVCASSRSERYSSTRFLSISNKYLGSDQEYIRARTLKMDHSNRVRRNISALYPSGHRASVKTLGIAREIRGTQKAVAAVPPRSPNRACRLFNFAHQECQLCPFHPWNLCVTATRRAFPIYNSMTVPIIHLRYLAP